MLELSAPVLSELPQSTGHSDANGFRAFCSIKRIYYGLTYETYTGQSTEFDSSSISKNKAFDPFAFFHDILCGTGAKFERGKYAIFKCSWVEASLLGLVTTRSLLLHSTKEEANVAVPSFRNNLQRHSRLLWAQLELPGLHHIAYYACMYNLNKALLKTTGDLNLQKTVVLIQALFTSYRPFSKSSAFNLDS